MTYGFYFFTCLCLIILQTTIIPCLPLLGNFYDLFIPFIVYLCLARPVRESIPVIGITGLIMDNLSGSPFMLYVIIYFWLYISLRWLTKIFQVDNRFRLPFIISLGVIMENLIFISTIAFSEPGIKFPGAVVRIFVVQVLWAFFTGTFFLIFLDYMHKGWDKQLRRLLIRRTDLADN
jgi:rod shape-determining protein MreD